MSRSDSDSQENEDSGGEQESKDESEDVVHRLIREGKLRISHRRDSKPSAKDREEAKIKIIVADEKKPFFNAIRAGDLSLVKKCIIEGIDVEEKCALEEKDAVKPRKMSAILLAASFGHLEVVNFLESSLQKKYDSESIFSSTWKKICGRPPQPKTKLEDANYSIDGFNFLHAAAEGGSLVLVKRAVENYKFLPNSYFQLLQRMGENTYVVCLCSPLELAVANGHRKVITYLLEKKAVWRASQNSNSTMHTHRGEGVIYSAGALTIAADHDDVGMITFLLKKGISVDSLDFVNETALQYAALGNKLNAARCLIENGADVNFYDDDYQESPIGTTLIGEHEDMFRLLLENKANPAAIFNISDYRGKGDCIDFATFYSCKKMLALLFSEICDHIDYQDTPAKWYEDDCKFYYENTDKLRLFRAARRGKTDYINDLLSTTDRTLHCHVNSIGEKGNTALHLAAIHEQSGVIQILLNKGGDVNIKNEVGDTPLMALLNIEKKESKKTIDSARTLLRHTDLEIQNDDEEIAAMIALKKGKTKVLDMLIKAKCDLDAKDNQGYTLFLLAVQENLTSYVDLFIKAETDILACTAAGENALMLSAYDKENTLGRKLIAQGVPVESKNKAGKTAFSIALDNKHITLCQILMSTRLLFLIANAQIPCPELATLDLLFKQGGHINQRDSKQRTLLHIAAGSHNSVFSEYLIESKNVDIEVVDDDDNTADMMSDNKKYRKPEYQFVEVTRRKTALLKLAKDEKVLDEVKGLLKIYDTKKEDSKVKQASPAKRKVKSKNNQKLSKIESDELMPSAKRSAAMMGLFSNKQKKVDVKGQEQSIRNRKSKQSSTTEQEIETKSTIKPKRKKKKTKMTHSQSYSKKSVPSHLFVPANRKRKKNIVGQEESLNIQNSKST